MKKLFLINLLIFSVNVYAQSFLCEITNSMLIEYDKGEKHNLTKMADVEVNNYEIILYKKYKIAGVSGIDKDVFSSKEKINLDNYTFLSGKGNVEEYSSYLSIMRIDGGIRINETGIRPTASYVNFYKCLEKK